MARKTDAPAQDQPRAPTFDLNDPALQAIIAQAAAVAMAAKAAEKPEKLSQCSVFWNGFNPGS